MFKNEHYQGDALTSHIEELSVAALHAVVAGAGGSMRASTRKVDAWGVDATCYFCGRFTDDPEEKLGFAMQVQLKGTQRPIEGVKDGVSCWKLRVDVNSLERYREWDAALVLFVAPPKEEIENWVRVKEDSVVLRESLYWGSFDGVEIDGAQKTATVYVPKTNLLTPDALVGIVAQTKGRKGRYYV